MNADLAGLLAAIEAGDDTALPPLAEALRPWFVEPSENRGYAPPVVGQWVVDCTDVCLAGAVPQAVYKATYPSWVAAYLALAALFVET